MFMKIDYIIFQIKNIMRQNKINQIQLSNKSLVPLQTTREIFRGKTKNPRIETIQALIKGIEQLTGENLSYLLSNNKSEEQKNLYITKNKANIFDSDGKLTEINISPENVNTIIAVIRTIETEQKSKTKRNITPIFIKPEGNEEELIPAVARSKDNAVKSIYLTPEEIEDILSERVKKDE